MVFGESVDFIGKLVFNQNYLKIKGFWLVNLKTKSKIEIKNVTNCRMVSYCI